MFGTTSLSTDRLRNLGMGNDLGFRLNGFRRAGRHSLSDHQGLRASYAVELRLRWKSAHASRHLLQHAAKKSIFVIAITSQTQRRRYSLLECSGGVSSEHFWIDGKRLRATTKAPQRGKGYAFSERRSSILVPSRRSELNLLLPMVGGRWGR